MIWSRLRTLWAIPMKLPKVVEPQDVVHKSGIKKTNGGYLSISYDSWKPKYVDETTGEVLQDNLINAAIIDEFDDSNQHVW